MPSASYDTLTIQINADSKQANSSIKSLSKNLQNLDDVAQSLHKDKIEEVKTLLLDIASIDFSNVSKGLQDVVSAFKSFQNKNFVKDTLSGTQLSGAYKFTTTDMGVGDFNINDLQFASIEKLKEDFLGLNKAVDLSNASFQNFGYTISTFDERIVFSHKTLEELSQDFNKIKTSLDGVKATLDPFTASMNAIGISGQKASEVARALVKELETIRFSDEELQNIAKQLEFIGYSSSQAQGVIKQLKHELEETGKKGSNALSKIAYQFKNILKYRIIRKIIQEIYKAFQEGITSVLQFDTGLQSSFNEIKDSLKYFTDSLGALLSPLIQIVAPLITMIADGVSLLANELTKMFAMLNGQSGYAKAIKGQKDWANEMKKTQSIGIDELNVFSQDNSGGNFEWVELANDGTSVLADTMQTISNVLGKVFELLGKVLQIITPIISTLAEVLLPIINTIFDVVGEIIDYISPIFDYFVGAIEFASNLFKTFIALIKGDWASLGDLWNNVCEGFKNAFKGFANFFVNVWNALVQAVEDFVNFISLSDLFSWLTGGEISWNVDFSGAKLNHFASGGFPEDGLFFANHNELVGRFANGQTAVANNEQITQGIYEAVLQAMNESKGNGNITIEMDGYKVAEIVSNRQNNMGANVGLNNSISFKGV